jgi:molybdopterin/thiamine biosynthesis adenylyltransferase
MARSAQSAFGAIMDEPLRCNAERAQPAVSMSSERSMDPKLYERYSRQILFDGIGEAGQQRLLDSSAVLIGCGALGTAVANLLVRAGLGRLRIVDRDFVEPSNLQRQTLFAESDARESLPKAIAAERHLREINSSVQVEGVVADLAPANAQELLGGFQLILDGADNFETRLLINDTAVKFSTPWIYAAVVASYGVTMTIYPGQTACLACLVEAGEEENSLAPGSGAGAEATCDTAGVLASAATAIAALEAAAAIRLLSRDPNKSDADDSSESENAAGRLLSLDVWSGRFQTIRVARRADCRACVRHDLRYLEGHAQPHLTMCGRDSVQIHERRRQLDLAALEQSLAATASEVRQNKFLLQFRVPPYQMTVFADGRAIIKGTRDPAVARSLYARYIGT